MAGTDMLVHVTHVDDSPKGREGPCVYFWGMTCDRNFAIMMDGYIEAIKKDLESRPPPMHQNNLMGQICCVLINQKWHRAQITQLKINPAGLLEVNLVDSGATHQVPLAFIRTVSDIPGREAEQVQVCKPLASRFILADIVAPRGPGTRSQWSELAICFLKIKVENHTWRAKYMGTYGECMGVRLFDQNNELLATTMIQQGLGVASQTYQEAIYTNRHSMYDVDLIDHQSRYPRPAYNPYSPVYNVPSMNSLPPAFAIPAADRGHHHPSMYPSVSPSLYSAQALPRIPKAYLSNEIPQQGRHEVVVSHVADGPFKFYLMLKSDTQELTNLRKKLESLAPHRFTGIPKRGTVCVALSPVDKLVHRGLITAANVYGDQCSVYFVDSGNQELVDLDMIREIPDELVDPQLFACRVSLHRAEEVAELSGLNAIFTALVNASDTLQCEVVENDMNQKVVLYDHTGRNVLDILLSIHSNIQPTTPASTSSSRPSSAIPPCITQIEAVDLAEEEAIRVVLPEEPGCFFGQLEKYPIQKLEVITSEISKLYSDNPNPPLLYADVKSHLGHVGIHQSAQDNRFYRVRIAKEMVHDSEIFFVDYGNSLRVPRCKILAPLDSLSQFEHPPFGIRCRLVDDVTLSVAKWNAAIQDKSIRVKIGKCVDGIYSVSFTEHPCNKDIAKILETKVPLKSTSSAETSRKSSPVPTELVSPPEVTNDDRRRRNNDFGNSRSNSQGTRSGYTNYVHPHAKESNWRTAAASSTEESAPNQTKSNNNTNWRSTSIPVQEVIRAPRGPPPSTGTEETKGPTGFLRQAPAEKPQQVVSSSTTLPPVSAPVAAPVPTPVPRPEPAIQAPSPVQKTLVYPKQQDLSGMTKPLEVVYVVSPKDFYVQLSESCAALDYMVEKLNEVYNDPAKPAIQNPKIGSACVVKYEEDSCWYRSEILHVSGPIAQVLFVDYGNTQRGSIRDVKGIDEEFVQLPPQAFHCRLSGVGNSRSWTDEEKIKFEDLTSNKVLTGSFPSQESNKYLVSLKEEKDQGLVDLNELFGVPSSPTNGSYSTLEVSTTLPTDVVIAWFYNPTRFFISPPDLTKYQTKLDELEEFYSSLASGELREDQPKVGLPCVVRFTEDHRYYRSQILSIRNGIAEVLFIDYGNEQDTPLSELKRIIPRFMEFPQLTWQCKLRGVQIATPINPDAKKHVASCFLTGENVSTQFHPVGPDGVFEVDLCEPKIGDVTTYLLQHKVVVRDPSTAKPEVKLAPQLEFSPGQTMSSEAIIPYFVSPSKFWVQLDPKSVDVIMERLDELALDPSFLNNKDFCPRVGKTCLAFFADDNRWYRATIETVDDDTAIVYYVDFGNSCSVETKNLRALPAEFSLIPALAYKCCLDNAQDLSQEDSNALENLFFELAVTVKCCRVADGNLIVNAYSPDGFDLKERACRSSLDTVPEEPAQAAIEEETVPDTPALSATTTVQEGVPSPLISTLPEEESNVVFEETATQLLPESIDVEVAQQPNETNEAVEVYISYSVTPNKFWFQLKTDESKLIDMQDLLAQVYQAAPDLFEITGSPVIDQYYGINHPTYDSWYRAEVKEIVGDSVVAYFLDYGDTHIVPIANNIRVLPKQFGIGQIPAMAIQASLKRNHIDWPDEIVDKFNEICFDPDMVCSVVLGTDGSGERFVDSFYVGGQNILDILSPGAPLAILNQETAAVLEEPVLESSHTEQALPSLPLERDISLPVLPPSSIEDQQLQMPTLMPIEENQVEVVTSVDPIEEFSPIPQTTTEEVVVGVDDVPKMELNFSPGEKMSSVALAQHISSATEIWIQLNPAAVDELMDQVAQTDILELPSLVPQIGRHCLALFPEDKQWYRAVVDSFDGNQATVTYIDYGNSSTVELQSLRVLPLHLAQFPGLALKSALDVADKHAIDIDKCMELMNEEVLTVIYVGQDADHLWVRLADMTGADLGEKLTQIPAPVEEQLEFSIQCDVSMASHNSMVIPDTYDEDVTLPLEIISETLPLAMVPEETEEVAEPPPPENVPVETFPVEQPSQIAVIVENIGDSLDCFFHEMAEMEQNAATQQQIALAQEVLAELDTDVTMEEAESFAQVEPNEPDVPAAEDAVEKSESAHCSVENDSVYSFGQHTPPPERDMTTPTQLAVVECPAEIAAVPTENVLSTEPPVSDETEEAQIDEEAPSNEEMALMGIKSEVFSHPSSSPARDSLEEVYISHVTSPGEFWIQRADNEQSIGDIDSQLVEMGIETDSKYQLEEPPVVGQLYAVKHPEFGYWYRAQLLTVHGEDAVVSFVEYGDRQIVSFSDIRKLSRILQNIPFMAIQCKLAAVHLDHWPQKSIDVMKNICRPEMLSSATCRPRINDEVMEIESLFVGDVDVVEAVLASLKEEPIPPTISPPISPSQSRSVYPTTSVPQLEAELLFTLVKTETDSLETVPEFASDSSALPVD